MNDGFLEMKLLQTDLRPVARRPVGRTGDVCVAGGQ